MIMIRYEFMNEWMNECVNERMNKDDTDLMKGVTS